MFTLTLFTAAAVLIGFLGGTFWLATAAIGFFVLKMYPLLIVVIVFIGVGIIALKYYWRQ
jgi:hypothetical protein